VHAKDDSIPFIQSNAYAIIYRSNQRKGGAKMPFGSFAISGVVAAVIAIVFGIVILKWPQSIAYLIGVYLIVIGVLFLVQRYLL